MNVAHQRHSINPDQVFSFCSPTERDAEPHCPTRASAKQPRRPSGAAATVRLQVFHPFAANRCGRVELAAQTDRFVSPLFIRYKAVYNYRPQNSDELELREGDVVQVVEKCDDGWFVGTELTSEPQNLFFRFLYFHCKQNNNSGFGGKLGS